MSLVPYPQYLRKDWIAVSSRCSPTLQPTVTVLTARTELGGSSSPRWQSSGCPATAALHFSVWAELRTC